MNTMSRGSSEALPLQPYQSTDRHLLSFPTSTDRQPTRARHTSRAARRFTNDAELRFLRVVGRNKILIVQPDELKAENPEPSSLGGASGQVRIARWNGRDVAVKYIRRRVFPDAVSGTVDQRLFHDQVTYDLNFELQIMSNKVLRAHRNIVKLLGVSFDTPPQGSSIDASDWYTLPTLVLELADRRFPDLSLYFDASRNHHLARPLSFETTAALIADIADGVAALHQHDVVHADLKPQNVLLFRDSSVPCGLVAKIADFGFSGLVAHNIHGVRMWHFDSRPRGGTSEWLAPECIGEIIGDPYDNYNTRSRQELPYDSPKRDVYSFGLLASYVALDGQSPASYIPDLSQAKLSGRLVDVVRARLGQHHASMNDPKRRALGSRVSKIVNWALEKDHAKREGQLNAVRRLLFDDWKVQNENAMVEKFVLNFDLFPQTVHEFIMDGLYAAYWHSPPDFRARVLDSFRRRASGIFAMFTPIDIERLLNDRNVELDALLGIS